MVINNLDSTPSLLRNVVTNENHWITIKLIGGAKSPRDAIGSKVFLNSGGARQRGDVISGGVMARVQTNACILGWIIDRNRQIEVFWPSGSKNS